MIAVSCARSASLRTKRRKKKWNRSEDSRHNTEDRMSKARATPGLFFCAHLFPNQRLPRHLLGGLDSKQRKHRRRHVAQPSVVELSAFELLAAQDYRDGV